ncbi:DUF418 domain-containing protein [Isachenkonia alkalipeptolytica]|uniref:DUF418 domain-containing protein n=1 Tax=Isachenkonia alkalipeptolytica TaxID=2565777 RepID=A0AA44BE10_9CLOT|nr:DUF418 domain-containing protein [Isachenkonia alkalipeptolytica]NBG87645.1 DUF418 domain-containing protein [Isachenkonia alkalipeptolytica]
MEARKKRIEALDILRGFALFGVLLVNLTMMHTSRTGFSVSRMGLEGINHLSALGIEVFFQGKFYTIFSILFGLGFFLFMNRKGKDIQSPEALKPFFIRRMLALLFFGLLHMVFVWHGDILHVYALIGLVLLWRKEKTEEDLLRGVLIWLLIAAFITGVLNALIEVPILFHAMVTSEMSPYADSVYSGGSYWELLRFRLVHEVQNAPVDLVFILPKILGLFYLGFYLGRKKLFENLKDHRGTLLKTLRYSAAISLIMILGLLFFRPYTGGENPYYTFAFLEGIFRETLTLSGSAFYISGLLLLLGKTPWKKILNPLKYLGKTALSNYLIQTLFWSWVFNGYGLGFYGRLPYWSFFPLATAFFILQILLSKWWLSRWKTGPMEALWRRFTYGT